MMEDWWPGSLFGRRGWLRERVCSVSGSMRQRPRGVSGPRGARQSRPEVDDSELEKSLLSFRCNFVGEALGHSRLANEGSGDPGTVELLDGHTGCTDEQSAALYGDVLI